MAIFEASMDMAERHDDANQESLDRLFRPHSIAVIGASTTPTKIGGLPISFLLANGFAGKIYPVSQKAGAIQDLKTYPSIGAVPEQIDLAIIAVPATMVSAAVEEAIAAGVSGIVLFSSGFAEVSEEGAHAQAELVAKVRAAGVRLLGPNCVGFMNIRERVFATFAPAVTQGIARLGRIGLISQSGAYGMYTYALARDRGLGLSHWITTGNESDVDFADVLAWLVDDPDTDVILGYMEGCRDGSKLVAALAAARAAGKPVVITKVGRTAVGAEAAASHTAALAGEDTVFDAVFRQYGVYRAYSIEEFFDIGYAVATAGKPAGNSLAIYTVSGGAGVLMADAAADAGLQVPELSAEGQKKIHDVVPFASARNPLDITAQIINDGSLLKSSLETMLRHGDYHMVGAFVLAAGRSPLEKERTEQVIAVRRNHPHVVFCVVGVFSDPIRIALEDAGCLVFEDPTRAVRALGALARLASVEAGARQAAALPASIKLEARTHTEVETLERLAAAGIPVSPTHLVASAAEAGKVAAQAKRPLVAKIVSPDITHKSDVGGVLLNLSGEQAVANAYEQLMESVRKVRPKARLEGVLLLPMEGDGVECIVGVQRDAVFGPMVMLGLGGVFVEVLGDVSFRRAPLTRTDARAMVHELRGRDLLFGARGRPLADVEALMTLLVAVSEFAIAAGETLESLDLNPVLVRPQGQGVIALDGLMVGRGQDAQEGQCLERDA